MPWPTKKLGEICEISAGGSAPQGVKYFENGRYPFFRTSDVGVVHLSDNLCDTRDYLNDHGIKNLKLFKKGTILFPKSGASTFLNHRVTMGCDGYVSSHLATISASEEIYYKFLYFFLTLIDAKAVTPNTAYPSLKISDIAKIEIPLPPLEIQKRIVERLDKIAEAQKLNDELIQKTDELFQSLLHSLIRANSGIVKRLGSMFKRITDSILPAKYPDQKFNFIGLENIESNTGQLINPKPIAGKFVRSTKTHFQTGDVLYGKLRPYLNKVWLAECNGICSTDIWVLRAEESVVLPQLLWSILQQPSIVEKSSASMSGANLPRANKDVFDNIKVAMPPLSEQKRIVAKLSSVQEYKKQLLDQKAKLKELFDSTLSKSMKGEMDE